MKYKSKPVFNLFAFFQTKIFDEDAYDVRLMYIYKNSALGDFFETYSSLFRTSAAYSFLFMAVGLGNYIGKSRESYHSFYFGAQTHNVTQEQEQSDYVRYQECCVESITNENIPTSTWYSEPYLLSSESIITLRGGGKGSAGQAGNFGRHLSSQPSQGASELPFKTPSGQAAAPSTSSHRPPSSVVFSSGGPAKKTALSVKRSDANKVQSPSVASKSQPTNSRNRASRPGNELVNTLPQSVQQSENQFLPETSASALVPFRGSTEGTSLQAEGSVSQLMSETSTASFAPISNSTVVEESALLQDETNNSWCCAVFGKCRKKELKIAEIAPNNPLSIYQYTPSTKPLEAPYIQEMVKRTPSARTKAGLYEPPNTAVKNLTASQRIELDESGDIYGIICDPQVQEARYTGKIAKKANERITWLVYPIGQDYKISQAAISQQLIKINTEITQNIANGETIEDIQYILNLSEAEKNGYQARFSIPIKNGELSVDNLEIVVLGEPKESGNFDGSVTIGLLSHLPYSENKLVLEFIKKQYPQIQQTLPNLQKLMTNKATNRVDFGHIKLVSNHDFDHLTGRNDAHNIGFDHDDFCTHHVPSSFNRARKMDWANERSIHFKTSIADDTLEENTEMLNSTDPESQYSKYLKSGPEFIPTEDGGNINAMQESSIKVAFNDNVRVIEFKAQPARTDVTHLRLTDQQKEEYGIYEETKSDGLIHDIFEHQKIMKGFRSMIEQTRVHLNKLSKNYVVSDSSNIEAIREELINWYRKVTKIGRIECNLLCLNSKTPESLCALENTKNLMITTQSQILDSILQLDLNNGLSNSTKESVFEEHLSSISGEVGDCGISDSRSFQSNVEFCQNEIEVYDFDRNQRNYSTSLLNRAKNLQQHLKTSAREERKQIFRDSKSVLPIIVKK